MVSIVEGAVGLSLKQLRVESISADSFANRELEAHRHSLFSVGHTLATHAQNERAQFRSEIRNPHQLRERASVMLHHFHGAR